MPKNRDQGIGLNSYINNRIVAMFILMSRILLKSLFVGCASICRLPHLQSEAGIPLFRCYTGGIWLILKPLSGEVL